MSQLIDTHAHLDDPRLKNRLDEVVQAAVVAGVVQVVAIGTTAADSGSISSVAGTIPGIFAAVGIHPNELSEAAGDDWAKIRAISTGKGVVAIGETGLDRHWDRTPFEAQVGSFGRHLELAAELELPVVIHCREAHRDVVAQLAKLDRPVRGVLHSFTGDWAEAQELLALGLHISFAGMLTFANKALDPLREAAAMVPGDRILVETDSPYLSPHPFRGKENEPSRVALTAAKLAEVRGVNFDEVAKMTSRNARNLFRLREDWLLSSRSAGV